MEEKTYATGFKWEKRKCVDCGKEFIAKQSRSVRCLDCRAIYTREQQRERQRQYREGEATPSKTGAYNPNVCNKSATCYYGEVAGKMSVCNYLEITKTRRPCKAGECVMYKRKDR